MMKSNEVKVGGVYTAKVTNRIVQVRIDATNRHGGWSATNLATGKKIRIKSPARLRAAVGDDDEKTHKATKKAKAAAEAQQAATSTPRGEDVANVEPVADVCLNCGSSEFDEDGDCAKCYEPKAAEQGAKTKRKRTAKELKPKRTSGLDAAARVLAEADEPMNVKQIVELAEEKGYWKSPGGKTPSATIYSAIIREIRNRKDEARFKKTSRGMFQYNNR